jgi:putative transposase
LKLKSAADLVDKKVAETLTYYAYPSTHWRQIPDGKSALMLVAARLRRIA